jgi:hypothetical protein
MAFFFPQAHGDIDWTRGYEFLDQELQRVTPDAALGRRRVDKLVKVWRTGGDEAWVLVHIEVQSQEETGFAERMYVYNYRLFDRYRRRVASLAVLGDEQAGWRPGRFGYELWGCRVDLTFPAVKLLDYRERWPALEASDNPFATVVMAHLKAQETRHDVDERKAWKWSLMRRLYERGYERQDVINLFRFMDWVLRLPEEVEEAFWQKVRQYEEASKMPYITSVERIGMKKGLEQGLVTDAQEAVVDVWEARFGEVPVEALQVIGRLDNLMVLRQLRKKAATAGSAQELVQAIRALPTGDNGDQGGG